jgi:hypothetical protein
MVLDNQDNVYVTGRCNSDYVTVKYSPEGEELWVMRLDGPAGGLDGATAITVDDYYNVYVTGFVDWTDSSKDYGTVKYRQHGRTPAYP